MTHKNHKLRDTWLPIVFAILAASAGIVYVILLYMAVYDFRTSTINTTVSRESWVQNVLETRYKVSYPDSAILANTIGLASDREGFDVELTMAIIKVETDYRSKFVSESGACGLMQVKTAIWQEIVPYKICDKYQNVFAGLWILGHYEQKLGSQVEALEAYNVGITSYLNGDNKRRGRDYRNKVLVEVENLKELKNVKIDTE